MREGAQGDTDFAAADGGEGRLVLPYGELCDGPCCVLSIVDNRTFRRLLHEVLDHDPDHADIERFFRRFQAALQSRKLVLHGITTDGSNLYPEPISVP